MSKLCAMRNFPRFDGTRALGWLASVGYCALLILFPRAASSQVQPQSSGRVASRSAPGDVRPAAAQRPAGASKAPAAVPSAFRHKTSLASRWQTEPLPDASVPEPMETLPPGILKPPDG